FSTFTTENEKGKEKALFISPSGYSPIIQNYREGNTILLTGDRGTGKTAILLDFIRNTDEEKTLYFKIDDYGKLSETYHIKDFYKFLITNLTVSLFNRLASEQNRINQLNDEEKIL